MGSFVVVLTLGERWADAEIGVPGLLGLGREVVGDPCEVGLCPVLMCRLSAANDRLGSAGEFRADDALGDGSDRFDVGLLGELGLGLGKATGTLAERCVWWYGGGGPCNRLHGAPPL